jgi:hypothetical protein
MPTDTTVARDKRYLDPAEPLHIVGREWCFEWYQSDIEQVIDLWQRGYSLTQIARRVNSTARDTLLLLIDLSEQGKIGKRIGYLWGVNS